VRERGRGFSLIVLSACILLLSITDGPNQRSASAAAAQNENAQSSPRATLDRQQPSTKSTATEREAVTYNYYGDFNYRSTNSAGLPWATIGDIATVLSTFLLAVFTGGLWWTSIRQWKAARASLELNRPFVLVTEVCREVLNETFNFNVPVEANPPAGMPDPTYTMTIRAVLRNFGVGPADILKYFAEAAIFDAPTTPAKQPRPVYRDADCNRLNDSLIAPNECADDRIVGTVSFTNADRGALAEDSMRIGMHGCIRYRGATETVYETRFFWWYLLPEDRFVRADPPELNAHT
jgi:hypothetical protein